MKQYLKTDLEKLIKLNLDEWKSWLSEDTDTDEGWTQLTIGYDDQTELWGYQTGDNSFTGAAYGFQAWLVVNFSRECMAEEIMERLCEEYDENTLARACYQY
jgi:hypothetical protein